MAKSGLMYCSAAKKRVTPERLVFLVDGDDKANQLQELREKTCKKENVYLTFGLVPICSRQN